MLEILLTYKFQEKLVKQFVNALSAVMAMIVIFTIIANFL